MAVLNGKVPWAVTDKAARTPTPALLADEPPAGFLRVRCENCSHLAECHDLERAGMPVLCEIPDELDVMAMEAAHERT